MAEETIFASSEEFEDDYEDDDRAQSPSGGSASRISKQYRHWILVQEGLSKEQAKSFRSVSEVCILFSVFSTVIRPVHVDYVRFTAKINRTKKKGVINLAGSRAGRRPSHAA